MNNRLPSLFISHGAPDLPLQACPARDFLQQLGSQISASQATLPQAILMLSPHWMTSVPTISTAPKMSAMHDFGGFPSALYQLRYEPPGSPALVQLVASHLSAAQIKFATDPSRGLDHGAWVPLFLMYPTAEIPVVQLSLPAHWQPRQLYDMGQALGGLRSQGILIIGSGSATHNLGAFGHTLAAEPPDWVVEFDGWLGSAIARNQREDLFDYRQQAPSAAKNHPSEEHLMPLFFAMGASNSDSTGIQLHSSYTYGAFSMAAYAFP